MAGNIAAAVTDTVVVANYRRNWRCEFLLPPVVLFSTGLPTRPIRFAYRPAGGTQDWILLGLFAHDLGNRFAQAAAAGGLIPLIVGRHPPQ
jgi:hypothetical protein